MRRVLSYKGLFVVALALFTYVYLVNAWVVDDAYITFRTVDNFVHGYGLTWNVGERVQAYSHPLWMLLVSVFYFVTREAFYTSIIISYLLCLATFVVAYRSFSQQNPPSLWKPSFLVLILIASKAFVDYTSSGLENALSYFLAMLFYARFLLSRTQDSVSQRDLFVLFFVAALAFLNRTDTLLLYLPALAMGLYASLRQTDYRPIPVVLVAISPAIAWLLFSLVYYGFPFPNTAYAKAITSGISQAQKVERGVEYLLNSMSWDSASYLVLLAAIVLAFWRRASRSLAAMAGVVFYVGYIVLDAASATHMSGRFFAVPFFITCLVLVDLIRTPKAAALLAVPIVLYMAISPVSAIKMGTPWYRSPQEQNVSFIDTKWFAHEEGAALLDWRPGKILPDHEWYHAGEAFRQSAAVVHIGGASGRAPIGYFGYAAGPDKIIVDYAGLSDPLLARLPVCNTQQWKSGHFFRMIPVGYVDSLLEGRNLIQDPDLHAYYDKLWNITSGPVFSPERLADVVRMNLGAFQHWVDAYAGRTPPEQAPDECINAIRLIAGPVR